MSLFFLLKGGGTVFTDENVDGITNISSTEDDGNETNAELRVNTNGTWARAEETDVMTLTETALTVWGGTAGPIGTWHMRVVFISGDDTHDVGGNALNTWIDITTAGPNTWAWESSGTSGPQVETGTYSVEISDDGGSTTHDGPNNFDVTLEIFSP